MIKCKIGKAFLFPVDTPDTTLNEVPKHQLSLTKGRLMTHYAGEGGLIGTTTEPNRTSTVERW